MFHTTNNLLLITFQAIPSILIDESNDNTDKSCIILVRVFDQEVGNDVLTRFLDMPIVNIGTARNIFKNHYNRKT